MNNILKSLKPTGRTRRWNGRCFNMLKFHSLPLNARNHDARSVWKKASDKQPARTEGIPCKTGLDGQPHMINVPKDAMSVAGV
ncbi:hypothetical protein [Candidatus Methylospira mobilis]|uniref:hypothetical protein n=1 Tax=Candidatus Methylospira mobilis TaxID=1808979 RepID=UPI00387EE219